MLPARSSDIGHCSVYVSLEKSQKLTGTPKNIFKASPAFPKANADVHICAYHIASTN
jgi:hypothetical protein